MTSSNTKIRVSLRATPAILYLHHGSTPGPNLGEFVSRMQKKLCFLNHPFVFFSMVPYGSFWPLLEYPGIGSIIMRSSNATTRPQLQPKINFIINLKIVEFSFLVTIHPTMLCHHAPPMATSHLLQRHGTTLCFQIFCCT
jgi:hypothetical protein